MSITRLPDQSGSVRYVYARNFDTDCRGWVPMDFGTRNTGRAYHSGCDGGAVHFAPNGGTFGTAYYPAWSLL